MKTDRIAPTVQLAEPAIRFTPLKFGRWLIWGLTAVVFITLPLMFDKKFALALMSQAGIMIIFALSYNMLLGQSGMLSFGHAVYSGLGAYFAIHAMNMIGKGTLLFPVSLLPLVGGAASVAVVALARDPKAIQSCEADYSVCCA